MSYTPLSGAAAECILNVSTCQDADIWLFSGGIENETVDSFICKLQEDAENRNKNLFLFLATRGGNPHAGYRLTRFVQDKYEKFILGIFGRCKSAGTLIAVGANELVMSDFAELGPLDVQVLREDEFRAGSVLDLQQALYLLSSSVYSTFETCLLKIVQRGGGILSARTAADIASSMAVGFVAPMSGQIDPMKLGELNRSMSIASAYGYRLVGDEDFHISVDELASGYPSHSFVIDYKEAKDLFPNVRRPTKIEDALGKIFYREVRDEADELIILNLLEKAKAVQVEMAEETNRILGQRMESDEDGTENLQSREAETNYSGSSNPGFFEENGNIEENGLSGHERKTFTHQEK